MLACVIRNLHAAKGEGRHDCRLLFYDKVKHVLRMLQTYIGISLRLIFDL
jgi:hypothetical protein